MRGERRRKFRERQAAEMNALDNPDRDFEQMASVLDQAINELGDEDRKAIVLRFYERLDLRAVGQALGSTENAAQKRVTRTLGQLHLLLTRRGIALSLAALGTALSCETVKAAPVGLAASIIGTVVAGEGAGAGTLASITKGFMITKTKLALVGPLLAGTVAAPLAIQHHVQVQAHSSPNTTTGESRKSNQCLVGSAQWKSHILVSSP